MWFVYFHATDFAEIKHLKIPHLGWDLSPQLLACEASVLTIRLTWQVKAKNHLLVGSELCVKIVKIEPFDQGLKLFI